MTTLAAAARRVLLLAIDVHRGDPATARWLRGQLGRLDEPLRVAIAGKVKAGSLRVATLIDTPGIASASVATARGIAQRYRADPTVRGLCQDVVAVAGLLAQTGATLRAAEFAALAELARGPRDELDTDLLSVDRFLRGGGARGDLLDRFGIFGIRLATTLIRQGTGSSAALATELMARSGLRELQRVLHTQFAQRRELLKARSALLAADSVLHRTRRGGPLAAEIERILAGAHEFTELSLLSALRCGATGLPRPVVEDAERLLGEAGAAAPSRLGLPPEADRDELRRAGFLALERWQRHAVNPMFGRAGADACRVVVRSCEGILSGLAG
ncbi:MAG: hypothetical protein LH603_03625 [Pseudonocardia sp.]|nr:hypothetical protein [Pseudonocardia sp.]